MVDHIVKPVADELARLKTGQRLSCRICVNAVLTGVDNKQRRRGIFAYRLKGRSNIMFVQGHRTPNYTERNKSQLICVSLSNF